MTICQEVIKISIDYYSLAINKFYKIFFSYFSIAIANTIAFFPYILNIFYNFVK